MYTCVVLKLLMGNHLIALSLSENKHTVWWNVTCLHFKSVSISTYSVYVVCCMYCVYCLICWGEVSGFLCITP